MSKPTKYLLVDKACMFVISVIIGRTDNPDFLFIERTDDLKHVVAGYRLEGESFVDDRANYDSHRGCPRNQV